MNNIRAIEALNQRELEAGIPLSASWHTDWADTAYVYIGGLPYELSEGDIITIFSQFGEPVHVNLIRDKDTGKSKGFAFLKYEDQRSTSLAVDNLGGATILGRIIRVDHTRYKPKEEEVIDENAHLDSGETAKDDDNNGGRHKRRRRRRGDGDDDGDDEEQRKKTPPQEMLKEVLELQKLMREHDEEDPMKEYLVRQKKEEIENALRGMKMKSQNHRHSKERGGKSEHRHRSHRHRSQSKERSRRHRSLSIERRDSADEINGSRDKAQRRTGDKGRVRGKDVRRERDSERRDNAGDRNERRERESGKEREREPKRERRVERGNESDNHKSLGRTDISRKLEREIDA